MSDNAMIWGGTPSEDDKLWATLAHLSVYVSALFGPLIILLLFSSKSKYVRYHAIQALAVQIGVVVLVSIIGLISAVTCGVGAVPYFPLLFVGLVPLWGAFKSYSGEWSGFPGLAPIGRG